MALSVKAADNFSIALLKAAGIDVDPSTVVSVRYTHRVTEWPVIVVEHFARDLDGKLVPELSELTFTATATVPVAPPVTDDGLVDVTTVTDTTAKSARPKD